LAIKPSINKKIKGIKMYEIPEVNNVLEKVGSFIGGKVVDATAVAGAILILRSGVKDPKI
jgi:hypothetical protein